MKKIIYLLFYTLIFSSFPQALAQKNESDTSDQNQSNNYFFGFFNTVGNDFISFGKVWAEQDAEIYALVAASTIALLPHDQEYTDKTKGYLYDKNILHKDSSQQEKVADIGGPIFLPNSPGGYAWYIGDGLFAGAMMAGFLGHGLIFDSPKSTRVSYQIFRSMILAGSVVFPTKMLTGRESPAKSTETSGKWHGFPGFKTYFGNQSKYYAFPSGHTATAVALFTVIFENYTEQTWIKPVGYVMIGSMMAALMGVDAHWPSDFPFAIMIGYHAGHAVVKSDKEFYYSLSHNNRQESRITPRFTWQGVKPQCSTLGCGAAFNWKF